MDRPIPSSEPETIHGGSTDLSLLPALATTFHTLDNQLLSPPDPTRGLTFTSPLGEDSLSKEHEKERWHVDPLLFTAKGGDQSITSLFKTLLQDLSFFAQISHIFLIHQH